VRAGGWYSMLNIGGLAVVLAVSVLLFWWVKDELTFDRFHPDAERTYRINSRHGKGADEQTWGSVPAPVGVAAMAGNVPGVEAATRITEVWEFKTLKVGNQTYTETNMGYADENFLTVLGGFRVLYGNPAKPFPTPNSVVLTRRMALKYFDTDNAVGKIILGVDSSRVFTVGAVLADMPDNSSLDFQVYFPMSLRKRLFGGNGAWKRMDDDWGNFSFLTLVRLAPGVDPATVGQTFTRIQREARAGDDASQLATYLTQPLTDMHLHRADGTGTVMQQVQMMGLIAVLILLIGCINYINLTTARATRRAREVGVRKAVGAGPGTLVRQLVTESVLTLLMALVLAVSLIQLLMPFYRQLTDKTLGFSLLDPQVWILLLAALLGTLLLACVYPALLIARFDPIRTLRGGQQQSSHTGLRKALVVVQFALATGLIVSTLVVGNQLTYLQNRDLGLTKEHVFTIQTNDKTEAFRKALASESSISGLATGMVELTSGMGSTNDTDWEGKAPGRVFNVNQMGVSYEFIPAMGMKLVAGRNFRDSKADSLSWVLNETAIRDIGLTNAEAIGKAFTFHDWKGQIIGVVKDFSFESAREKVAPTLLFNRTEWNGVLYVKTTGANTKAALAAAERVQRNLLPNYPFQYTFLSDAYTRLYKNEQRTGQLFRFFAGVAILVCCLGLLGLSAYTAEQRTKEIGVRKVLGASVSNIVILLSKDFLTLVAFGILVAVPLAWWAMNAWLSGFAYRTDLSWWVFALAGALAVGIALLTVSAQSIRAALANPVKALKSE
jgi:putative ABC transport system permease protein